MESEASAGDRYRDAERRGLLRLPAGLTSRGKLPFVMSSSQVGGRTGRLQRAGPRARCFFHLRGPAGLERDDTGLEYANLELAYLEAVRTIPGVSGDLIREGRNPMEHAFVITDAGDTPLLEVPFNEMTRDARKLHSPSAEGARGLLRAESVHDLVASVRQNLERLRTQMRESREWVAQVPKLDKDLPGGE